MAKTESSSRANTETIPSGSLKRVAPPLTARTSAFWQSGEDGKLRIAHCRACGWYVHPPSPLCPKCRSFDVQFDAVSGKGHVYAFTINRYPWFPDMPPPYVIAEIELIEQAGLRITSNVIDCPIEEVRTGMAVDVAFEQVEDTWIPVFHP